MKNNQNAVKDFLAFFDDDPIAAVHAIRDYAAANYDIEEKKPAKVSDNPVLLTVKDLTKKYKLGKQKINVLNGISLEIHEGEFVAITGASGSGKSTLLQLMGGLDKPTSGEVIFGDKNLAKLSDSKLSEFRRQTVGFVFQFFYLQPFLRLENNITVPAMFAATKKSERLSRVRDLAEKVGLSDRLRHFPKELSGGQMQRAAISRALVNNPKILLADEPTGNLDSENGRAIVELFETIRDEFGMAVVIVTHDRSIADMADREIKISDGVLV